MDSMLDMKAIYKETTELLEYLQTTFKNRMRCQVVRDINGYYTNINIIPDENGVYDQITTSASLLVVSNELKTENYEKKILNEIQNLQEEEIWIESIFLYIQQLPKREKHYIIAFYFINEKNDQIMDTLGVKTRTLKQIKSKAITHLGMLVPGGIRIKQNQV